jgi:hypothetical protein
VSRPPASATPIFVSLTNHDWISPQRNLKNVKPPPSAVAAGEGAGATFPYIVKDLKRSKSQIIQEILVLAVQ